MPSMRHEKAVVVRENISSSSMDPNITTSIISSSVSDDNDTINYWKHNGNLEKRALKNPSLPPLFLNSQ